MDDRIRSIVTARLESLHTAGVTHLPRGQYTPEDLATTPPPAGRGQGEGEAAHHTALTPTLSQKEREENAQSSSVADVQEALAVLREEVAACTQCRELADSRTQTVFGVGNPQARLCFLGEAPGADEDRQGEPFVGRAGQLLNRIIEACRMQRSDVYILNILKCRPPGNRNPSPTEAANCRPFLNRQLDLLRPEFICCLGAVAAQNLLGTTSPIGKLRGKFWDYQGAQVVCTYHPAYLLRNPAAKKDAWDDMKLLMRAMGVDLDAP